MDKILRINVGAEGGPQATIEALGDYAGLGGRAMTTAVVCKEVPPTCHPLGPENKLVFSPGLMSGSAATTSGRMSVGCKSPLTGGIKESNTGGTASQALARLGYAAIILEGERQGKDLYKVMIDKDGVRIEKANELRMFANYDMVDKLKETHGDKVTYMTIGTAGEMLMSNSTICVTDPECRPTRHAGRGGVGAVMGSKGIKVFVLDSAGTKTREPKNPELFRSANQKLAAGLKSHPVTGEGLPAYGTTVLINILNEAGGLPTNNFSNGRFDRHDKISGETMAATIIERGGEPTHGCHRGCGIRCSGIYLDKEGKYLSKAPEYETIWAHGAHCGIDDLDAIVLMDRLEDDYGFDTIDMGVAIGLAMNAGAIPYGDAQAAIDAIHAAGRGTPFGRILGAGAATVGRCYGLERVPVVKGQALPAYDPRAVKGVGVTYATTTQGADHTAGYAVAPNILGIGGKTDPLSAVGQAATSRDLQIATAALDSTGFCLFVAFCILDQPESFQAMIDTINGMYDMHMTGDDVVELGKTILRQEREFNRQAGFGPASDRLPMFFSREKLDPHGVVFDVSDEELDSVHNY